MARDRKDILGMALFALSVALLFYMSISPLNSIIFSLDEFFTKSILNFPVSDLIGITAADVHPPLYYLILKFAAKLTGIMGINGNLLYIYKIASIIPYALLIIVSATKIRKQYGWLTTGLFIFSVGVMTEFFKYYLIIRMYSWAVLFLVLAFVYARDVLEKRDLKSWILMAIFSVIGAYTHYFAAIPAVCLYLIIFVYIMLKDRPQIRNWIISAVVGILLYSPWVLTLIDQLKGGPCLWIPGSDLNLIISSLGYFAGSETILIILAIITVAAISVIYLKQSDEEMTRTYVMTGIGVYVFTIILSLIIELVFKPILVTRYLLPASAVLWFAISIMIGKIEDKRAFIFSFALIALLLICGTATMISDVNDIANQNATIESALNQIVQDNESILVLPQGNIIMYFLDYSNATEVYCYSQSHDTYSISMDRLHKVFDFKEMTEENLTDLVMDNPDRNVYIIYWNDLDIDQSLNKTPLLDNEKMFIYRLSASQ